MSWLEQAADQLAKQALAGSANSFAVRKLADGALLLRNVDITLRANRLLAALPETAFIAGAITNITWTPEIVARLRAPSILEAVERRYPRYDEEVLLAQIGESVETERHLALALRRRFDEALAAAQTSLAGQDVCDVAAVLGEFEEAARIAADPRLEDRRRGISWVIMLEKLRRGRAAEVIMSLEQRYGPDGPGPDGLITLELIGAGRIPWGGYPFSDW